MKKTKRKTKKKVKKKLSAEQIEHIDNINKILDPLISHLKALNKLDFDYDYSAYIIFSYLGYGLLNSVGPEKLDEIIHEFKYHKRE